MEILCSFPGSEKHSDFKKKSPVTFFWGRFHMMQKKLGLVSREKGPISYEKKLLALLGLNFKYLGPSLKVVKRKGGGGCATLTSYVMRAFNLV